MHVGNASERVLKVLLVLPLLMVWAGGCQPGGDDPDPGDAKAGFSTLSSPLSRDTAPTLEAGELNDLVAGNTAFALDLYHWLTGKSDNLFFSPYSISMAMAMTYAGASGATAANMAAALRNTLADDRLHKAFNRLGLDLDQRDKENERLELSIVNALWAQKDCLFLDTFLDLLALNYGAGIHALDFIVNPEQARKVINDWVAQQTHQRIMDLLPPGSLSSLTRLVLTNAMYFKAPWAIPFNPQRTVDGIFTRLDGGTETVPMMNLSPGTGEFGEAARGGMFNGYSAVELPYLGNTLSMVLIVPESGRFREIESALDAAFLNDILAALEDGPVGVSMPRFEFECEFSLSRALSALGMGDAFTQTADFSGMTGECELFIGDVFHKAFVSVDEAGTEAAAATAVNMTLTAVGLQISLDRPFIFLIRENGSGTILFMGRVLNPVTE